MDVTKPVSLLVSFLVVAVIGSNDVNYGYLGNLSMASPWYTIFRPLPAPQSPDVIATAFYLYTRAQPARYYVTKLPDIALTGSDFSGVKPTFFITHGFIQDGNTTWLSDIKNALLQKFDANVVIVDWGHGSRELNYLQAAANIRVPAAEVVRLGKYLISKQGSSPSSWNLIGHSLGAQLFSYVAKAIPGVAKLIALDPAQPAFEGYVKDVRLDVTDAVFVEVIHTDAVPTVPTLGFGMMGAYGHVDYYMNGGAHQPGCPQVPLDGLNIMSLSSLANVSVETIGNIVSCSHCRAITYFYESLVNSCNFWGHTASLFPTVCTSGSCSSMGLNSNNYPARGSFEVTTNIASPYCLADSASDSLMQQYRQA